MNASGGRNLRRTAILGGLGFLLLVLVLTTVFGKKGLIEITRTRRQYSVLLQEVERLRREKARLESEIAALQANPKAVESEAREKLWLTRPDEKVIIRK